MDFMKKFVSGAPGISDVVGGVMSGVGSALGAKVQRGLGESPEDQAHRYFNKVAPGTNPWERLGGAGGGQAALTAAASKKAATDRYNVRQQMDLGRANIEKDIKVAKIHGQVELMKHIGVQNPRQLNKFLKAFDVGGVSGTSGMRGALDYREKEIDAQLSQAQAALENASTNSERLTREWADLSTRQMELLVGQVFKEFEVATDRLAAMGVGNLVAAIAKYLGVSKELFGTEGIKKPLDVKRIERFKRSIVEDRDTDEGKQRMRTFMLMLNDVQRKLKKEMMK